MADTPSGMDGIYPRTADAADLHAATISQARVLDNYLQTFKAHNTRITGTEARTAKLEVDLAQLQADKAGRDAVSKWTILYITGGFALITLSSTWPWPSC